MIVLQIDFRVVSERVDNFIQMFNESYSVALSKQPGYVRSRLLQLYSREDLEAIEAEISEFNLQVELTFDTEAHRRRWAQSDEHARVWSEATALCEKVIWRGYTVETHHSQSDPA